MFRWTLMVKKLFTPPPPHVQEYSRRPKARRPQTTVKLNLEVLEDRTLPSVSVATASPPAAPQVAAVLSYLASTMDQVGHLMGTVEQEEIAFYQALGQEIALAVSSFQQQWYSFLGINPNAAKPSQGTAATQPGSGTSTTTANGNAPTQGIAKPRQSGGPQINFSSAGYTQIENTGTCGNNNAILQINLSASSSNSVSVDYATSDGSAIAGKDYTAVSSSVTFAPGQTQQNISIPILDDGTDETVSIESFYVTLSNPSGGTLGTPSTATVNIPEAPQQQATDTLQWNPCNGNNASDPTNWYDLTIGGNLSKGQPGLTLNPPIQFDGNSNDKPNSNANITWDQSFTVASISLEAV